MYTSVMKFGESFSIDIRGYIFDIQRYSLHDGPGIRTVVFMMGCPLRCGWCCNPESQERERLSYLVSRCTGCGLCLSVCPVRALRMKDGKAEVDWSLCTQCGQCVEVCPSQALRITAKEMSVAEVMAEVKRDIPFYQTSGGGLTLSGGEPLAQPDFARALLEAAKAEYLHTVLETCGYAPWTNLESLLPYLDLVLYDIKHIDDQTHRQGTGVSNALILDNARRLATSGVLTIARVPLIPGFNASPEALQRIADFIQGLGFELHLLPYHTLGRAKYRSLGRSYPWDEVAPLPDEEVQTMAALLRARGLKVDIGGGG